MFELWLPVVVCLFLWWLGTGIVLRLDSRPAITYQRTMMLFTTVALASIGALVLLRTQTTVWSAYLAFVATLIIWGWLEFMHYSGYLVGPRTSSCPPGVPLRVRFMYALHAMLYHEIALAAGAVCLWVLTAEFENKTALYTYLVLWLMRISAELNVFFGVAYLPEEWLPKRLQYLMTYRRKKRFNAFFLVSVFVATLICIRVFAQTPSALVDAHQHTANILIGTLLLLAIIEHWLLVLPVKSASLWLWAHGKAVS